MGDLIGKTLLNQYYLRERAGRGGEAEIYQAYDKQRNVLVAVKVLRRDLSQNANFNHRFSSEAEFLRKLEHPNIVRFYQFGHYEGISFIVLDWISGSNLRQAIMAQKGPLPLAEISRILRPICSALFYAHQKAIFHCDVKPPNILLSADGRVLLTDFGVARLASESLGGGTPLYMAPEQFSGGIINERTDVYGLGVTLYEMLSGGMVPFRGESPSSQGSTTRERIAWEHEHLPLPPLSRYNPSVSDNIEKVVRTALSKEPEERYSSVMDLLDAFENARMQPNPALAFHKQEARVFTKPSRTNYSPMSGPHLAVCAGQRKGALIPLRVGVNSIGRSSSNAIVFPERSVSRFHASITRSSRFVTIQDVGSKSGTFVNDRQIPDKTPMVLKDGDVIRIGDWEIFEYREK